MHVGINLKKIIFYKDVNFGLPMPFIFLFPSPPVLGVDNVAEGAEMSGGLACVDKERQVW